MAAAGLMEDFTLPADLEAAEPPEARGLRRDEVRLLISDVDHDSIEHAQFRDLPKWLSAGDLLVVNTSGTLNAALPATSDSGEAFELHLSTELPGGFWTVEVRRPGARASVPCVDRHAGITFRLPAGGSATLLAPYPLIDSLTAASRLWIAALHFPVPSLQYLDQHGTPIRYSYVTRPWPSSMYQTVFATEPAVRRCRRPADRSRRSSSLDSFLRVFRLRRCCSTLAWPVWSITNRRTKSTTACPVTLPSASTQRDTPGDMSWQSGRQLCVPSRRSRMNGARRFPERVGPVS